MNWAEQGDPTSNFHDYRELWFPWRTRASSGVPRGHVHGMNGAYRWTLTLCSDETLLLAAQPHGLWFVTPREAQNACDLAVATFLLRGFLTVPS